MAEHPAQVALYALIVVMGIAGNAVVLVLLLGSPTEAPEPGALLLSRVARLPPWGLLIGNLMASNALLGVTRNTLLLAADAGFDPQLGAGACRALMSVWTMARCVNTWSCLAPCAYRMFKMIRLGRRVSQGPRLNSMGVRGGGDRERCAVKASLALVWGLNAAYAAPGLFFTTAKRLSTAQGADGGSLMLISSTTRPLLGCVWDFGPGGQGAGFVFVMASLVAHEVVPIVLMVVTNAASLVALRRFAVERKQGQQQQQAPWGRETPEVPPEEDSCRVYDGSESRVAGDPAGGVRELGSEVIGEPPASDVGGSTGGPRALAMGHPTGNLPCGQPGPAKVARGHAGGDGGGLAGGSLAGGGLAASSSSSSHGLAAEVRATRLVLALVLSFVASWGSHILAVNFYNFGGRREGPLAGALLALARFSASTFLALCPLILALGHAPLRRRLRCVAAAASSPRRRRRSVEAGGVRVAV
uniref:Olfactory receptor class A-like protein 4 n=1 Tax=Petromyzon marinus TaxID=7757 RepID=A0AAJ7X985_PETMA|nr:olfactory receptor class A-like protein 4 [Petromyzon marinus]